jgi:hypothetical protein
MGPRDAAQSPGSRRVCVVVSAPNCCTPARHRTSICPCSLVETPRLKCQKRTESLDDSSKRRLSPLGVLIQIWSHLNCLIATPKHAKMPLCRRLIRYSESHVLLHPGIMAVSNRILCSSVWTAASLGLPIHLLSQPWRKLSKAVSPLRVDAVTESACAAKHLRCSPTCRRGLL